MAAARRHEIALPLPPHRAARGVPAGTFPQLAERIITEPPGF